MQLKQLFKYVETEVDKEQKKSVFGMENYLVISEQQMKTRQSPPQSAVRNINSLQSQMLHLRDHQNLQTKENKTNARNQLFNLQGWFGCQKKLFQNFCSAFY